MDSINSKRIGFLADKSAFGQGGISTFLRGLKEITDDNGWILDIIVPSIDSIDRILYKDFNIVQIPTKNPNGAVYNKLSKFYKQTFNVYEAEQVAERLRYQFERVTYDLLIFNHSHSILSGYALDVFDYIPSVYYTHIIPNKNLSGHAKSLRQLVSMLSGSESFIVGTQSKENLEYIESPNKRILRLPGDSGLHEELIRQVDVNCAIGEEERQGILFIGRCENNKGSKTYLKYLKEADLPAKILTSKNSLPKWKSLLAEYGITKYNIEYDLYGKKKYDFIKSARIAFLPSMAESFSYAAFEALHFMPTILLAKYEWTKTMVKLGAKAVSDDEVVEVLRKEYSSPSPIDQSPLSDYYDAMENDWIEIMDIIPNQISDLSKPPEKIHEFMKKNEGKWIPVSFLFKKVLNRKDCAIIDFQAMHRAKHFYYVHNTAEKTYFLYGKTPNKFSENFNESESESILNFFGD